MIRCYLSDFKTDEDVRIKTLVTAVAVIVIGLIITEFNCGRNEDTTAVVTGKRYEPAWKEPDYYSEDCDSKNNCTSTWHQGTYHPEEFHVEGRSVTGEGIVIDVNSQNYASIVEGMEVPVMIHTGAIFGSRTARLR